MKSFARFFAPHRKANLSGMSARQRFARTMPGETGALASLRLTGMGL